jgi:hypothetical protein
VRSLVDRLGLEPNAFLLGSLFGARDVDVRGIDGVSCIVIDSLSALVGVQADAATEIAKRLPALASGWPLSSPAKDLEAVRGCVRRHEVGDCPGISPRAREECHRPLRDALVLHVDESARFRLVQVFSLQH